MQILLLSYYFYPYSLIGSKRMTSLANFLANAKNYVTVLKADNSAYDTHIIYDGIINENIRIENVSIGEKSNWIADIFAFKKQIIMQCKKIKFDCCIISGGPFNYFLLSRTMKKNFGDMKIIIDFRDVAATLEVASGSKNANNSLRKMFSFIKNYYIEYTAARFADKMILTSDKMKKFYEKRFPKYMEKMDVVYNGYDGVLLKRSDFKGNQEIKETNKMTFGIFGKFSYYGREYADILHSGCKLLQKNNIDISIMHIGEHEKTLETIFRGCQYFQSIPTMDYIEGLKKLNQNRIMIISHYMREAISTKIFDYIFLNKPIIAFLPEDTASEEILSKFENAYLVHDAKEFVMVVKKIYEEDIYYLTNETQNIKQYNRDFQNEQYSKIMKSLIE